MSDPATPPSSRGQLACGRDVDDLLEQAAAGDASRLTDHQRTCPHCQAALAEFVQLWQPVHAAAATRVQAPESLTAAVMAEVNRLISDVWYTFQRTDIGAIHVAARVVGATARAIARTVPGVQVALGSSTHRTPAARAAVATQDHLHPHAAVGVLGRSAAVELALAVEYGSDIDAVARDVQHRVATELRSIIGLTSVTVNVTVDDIHA